MFDFVLLDEDSAQFFKFFVDSALGTGPTLWLWRNWAISKIGVDTDIHKL